MLKICYFFLYNQEKETDKHFFSKILFFYYITIEKMFGKFIRYDR